MFTVSLLHPFVNLTSAAAGTTAPASAAGTVAVVMMVILAIVLIVAMKVLGRIVIQMAEIVRVAGSAIASTLMVIVVVAVFLVAVVRSMH